MRSADIRRVTLATALLLFSTYASEHPSAAASGPTASSTPTGAATPPSTAATTPPAPGAQCPPGADATLVCTTVTVPVDPAHPGGPTLNLAVTIRRKSPASWTKPVLIIPGSLAAVDFTNTALYGSGAFVGHDLIAVDVRGAGRSDENAPCPELADYRGAFNTFNLGPKAIAAATACVTRSANNAVPLATILDHDIVAADFTTVRKSVGIDSWSVYATLGGVDTLMHLLAVDAAAVNAVVALDPNAVGAATNANTTNEAFNRMAADSAASPKCAPAGDLNQRLSELVARPPVTTHVTDADGTPITLDATVAKLGMRAALFDPKLVPNLPAILSAPATPESNDAAAALYVRAPGDSSGATLALTCQNLDFATPGLQQSAEDHGGPFVGMSTKRFCDQIGPMPQMRPMPAVTSAIPALVVLSSYDPRSSETVARTIFDGFSHTTVVKVPGNVSAAALHGCFDAKTTSFIDAPTSPIDTSCLTKPATTVFG